jgi:hypothetical protein
MARKGSVRGETFRAETAAILERAYERAVANFTAPIISDASIQSHIKTLTRNHQNRAGVRVLLSSLLAKIDDPRVDIRKPYTRIGDSDVYSGRGYDENYVTRFIHAHNLPCNPTTAYLTPALRNLDQVLSRTMGFVGRPARVYASLLELINGVYEGSIIPEDLLAEVVRDLLSYRDERDQRMQSLLASFQMSEETLPLSAEGIIALVEQHLKLKHYGSRGSSRLPVLIIAAAYKAATQQLGERVLPLRSHNAADEQTGSFGDVEITLVNDEQVITSYEMKMKAVVREDIDRALQKVRNANYHIEHYLFITTAEIDPSVQEYAVSLYEQTGGTEFVILDCIGFLRFFLHLFHRLRSQYLDAYQELLIAEPDSAINQPLKEAFLAMRRAAESDG